MSHSDSEVNRPMNALEKKLHMDMKVRSHVKADVRKRERFWRKLRLLRAVSSNNTDAVERELNMGTFANCIDRHGRTALHVAASKGYTKVVELLLKHGADPNQNDKLQNTPLHLAACTHNLQVISLLISAGADVGRLDLYGKNPLQLAQSKLQLLQRGWRSGTIEILQVQTELQLIVDILIQVLTRQRSLESKVEELEFMKLSLDEDSVDDKMSRLLTDLQEVEIS